MKKIIFFFWCALFIPALISAQHIEIGVSGGISTYYGDLSPEFSKISNSDLNAAGGGFIRYNHNDFISAKLGLTYGTISGDDAKSSDEGRQFRNLHFKSHIFEVGFTGEINILGFDPKYRTRIFSPYLFAGVSIFSFNPQALYDGKWVELQPLGTEGQGSRHFPERNRYQLLKFAIPVGGGLKFSVNEKLNIGAEIGLRKTFTDYLDDVSTSYVEDELLLETNGPVAVAVANRTGNPVTTGQRRGNEEYNDWFIFSQLTLSFNLIDTGYRGRRRGRSLGCPTF